jgi:hypothetical protein
LLRPPKVYSTAHFRLSDNVENLILQGNADLQGYGNGLSNALTILMDSVVRILPRQPASPVFQRLTCERRSKWRRRAWRGCT